MLSVKLLGMVELISSLACLMKLVMDETFKARRDLLACLIVQMYSFYQEYKLCAPQPNLRIYNTVPAYCTTIAPTAPLNNAKH